MGAVWHRLCCCFSPLNVSPRLSCHLCLTKCKKYLTNIWLIWFIRLHLSVCVSTHRSPAALCSSAVIYHSSGGLTVTFYGLCSADTPLCNWGNVTVMHQVICLFRGVNFLLSCLWFIFTFSLFLASDTVHPSWSYLAIIKSSIAVMFPDTAIILNLCCFNWVNEAFFCRKSFTVHCQCNRSCVCSTLLHSIIYFTHSIL